MQAALKRSPTIQVAATAAALEMGRAEAIHGRCCTVEVNAWVKSHDGYGTVPIDIFRYHLHTMFREDEHLEIQAILM